MENIIKKVAYLKGLADGLEISEKTDEGKVLLKIIEVLDDMADAIDEIAADQEELMEQVDEIDEDLAAVEDDLYEDDCDCDCDCDCDDDMEYYELECPSCKEVIYLDEDIFDTDEAIECPNCGQEIELDFDCDCDCDDCGCGCENEE